MIGLKKNGRLVKLSKESVEHLPLRELFTDAERLTRELIDHIERGFLPKCGRLNELCQSIPAELGPDDIEDITIRNHAAQVLESEQFTQQFYENTENYLFAINRAVGKITGED